MCEQTRLFNPPDDVIHAAASWSYGGWTYRIHHRASGSLYFARGDELVVANLTTPELLDVVDATWARRLRL